jgi:hypothetical protein
MIDEAVPRGLIKLEHSVYLALLMILIRHFVLFEESVNRLTRLFSKIWYNLDSKNLNKKSENCRKIIKVLSR